MIFVDSSFWIALADARDTHHPAAAELLRERQHDALLTSNHIVGETWTLLRRRHSHHHANVFLSQAEQTARLEIAFVTPELERRAWAWLRHRDERPYSFVDATSFALMRHRRVGAALAFDDDFAAAGFVALRS